MTKVDLQSLRILSPVTSEEKSEVESTIYTFLYDPNISSGLFSAWHTYFKNNNFSLEIIQKWYDTYWKWYVTTSWHNFFTHTEEEIVEIVSVQFLMAFRLGFDVPKLYKEYLFGRVPEDEVQNRMHASIVEIVKKVNFPFDYGKGADINTLLRQINQLNSEDLVTRSALYAELDHFLFDEAQVEPASTDVVIARIGTFFDFIRTITNSQSITDLRSDYLASATHFPTTLDGLVLEGAGYGPGDSEEKVEKTENIFRKVCTQILDESKTVKEDKDEWVLNQLQVFSEQYQDPRILDLYYYDEAEDKFVWNEELLREE